jgi:translocation and assembly module TamB
MKTLLKILAYFLAVVFGLILLVLVFMQTSWFKDLARNQIEAIANEQLNGTLNIGNIEGTILGDLQIKDIYIQKGDTTILFVKEIAVDYNLLGILSSSIEINYAIIDSFSLLMKQQVDSTWNLAGLVNTTEDPDTTSSSFDWEIEVNKFKINNSVIKISVLDTASVIPQQIKDINLSAKASILPEVKRFSIDQFSLITNYPNLTLENLVLETRLSDSELEIANLIIKTSDNKISASGKYFMDDSQESIIQLTTEQINFREFKDFLPDLNLNGNPVVKLNGAYKSPNADLEISIQDGVQNAELSGKFGGLNSKPSYYSQLKFNDINIGYWLSDSSMNTNINAELLIEGSGTSLEEVDLIADLTIHDSELLNRTLDSLTLKTAVKNRNAETTVRLRSEFGKIIGSFNITELKEVQKFTIDTRLIDFNTAPLLLNDSLQSNINLSLIASVTNFNPNKMNGNVSLFVDSSTINNYLIDSIISSIEIDNGIYSIEKLNYYSSAAEVKMKGKYGANISSDISFNIKTKDLSTIPELSNYDNLTLVGNIDGKVKGRLDSLSSILHYDFNNLSFQTNSAEKLYGDIELLKLNDSINVALTSQIEMINVSENTIYRVELEAKYSNNIVNSNLRVKMNDNASANLSSTVEIDSTIEIIISQMDLALSDSYWNNKNDSMKIVIIGNDYRINNFNLANGNQGIRLEGSISPQNSDLSLAIDSLNIKQFLSLLNNEVKAFGIIDAEVNIGGNIEALTANGKIEMINLSYDGNEIGDINSEVDLKDEKLSWNIELDHNGNKIISKGFVPIIINADSSQSIIPGNKQLSFDLKIDSLELNKFTSLLNNIDEFEGLVKSDIKLYNTLDELKGSGLFSIKDAIVKSELLGIAYDNINVILEADSQHFYIREFAIINDDGKLSIDGSTGYSGGLLMPRLNQLKMTLSAKEFELVKTQNYEAKIDGKLELRNVDQDALIEGGISIQRSRIYLPYFTDVASSKNYNQNMPLLIKELEQNATKKDNAKLGSSKISSDTLSQPEFIKNINAKFTLLIPKNTWITSPDMNIELSGELDVVKNYEVIELFGNVNTVRGQFAIYGKEFSVLEGNINFNGGKEYNPNLNIILEYMFRSADRTKKYLKLTVTGKAQNPNLSFSLDGSNIDEGNAISYLLFGKSLDQLTQSQQTDVSNSETDLVKTLAGNFLAAQLTSSLGDALGLDVIEIDGSESWQQATLRAGKYLTDDLYVSYERGIGSTETNEVDPRIVTMEYQLTKFLFFQLVEGNDKTTGFDAIIKFSW